ncbi:MAG: UbiA family prenyltransferase [bacterium]
MKKNIIISIVKQMRLGEAFIICGFVISGYVHALEDGTNFLSKQTLLFFITVYLLILSVWLFNSFTGYEEDRFNKRLGRTDMVGKNFYLFMTLMTFIISLILSFCFSISLAVASFAVFLLWMLYSISWKYKPFTGTSIHLFVQLIQFHLGYYFLEKQPSVSSLSTAFYLGILFSAGHLHHELIDYETDKKTGSNSGAVYLGRSRAVILCASVFVVSFLLLFLFYMTGTVVGSFFIPFASAHFLQFLLWFKLVSENNPAQQKNLITHRAFYRVVFFSAGSLYILMSI